MGFVAGLMTPPSPQWLGYKPRDGATSPASLGRKAMASTNRRMDGAELGAVGEGRLDLDLVDHVGDALHHLLAAQHLGAVLHQVGDRAAVTRALDDEIADQRHGFGIVELDAALEASTR